MNKRMTVKTITQIDRKVVSKVNSSLAFNRERKESIQNVVTSTNGDASVISKVMTPALSKRKIAKQHVSFANLAFMHAEEQSIMNSKRGSYRLKKSVGRSSMKNSTPSKSRSKNRSSADVKRKLSQKRL